MRSGARVLRGLARRRPQGDTAGGADPPRTTARPPTRPVTLESLAAGVHEIVDKRTSLHELHVAAGARLDRSGGWLRPFSYGDWREEYRAVRERVSVMDVGTLGEVHDRGPRCRRARGSAVPVPNRRPGTRPHPLRAHARRGGIRDGRRSARARRRRRVVPHLDLGRRRAHGCAPAEPRRPAGARRARARSHGAVGSDQRRRAVRARSARTRSPTIRSTRRPCPTRGSPT